MPSRKHNLHTLNWSEGSGKNLAKNKNFSGHWGQFFPKFAKPFVTPEKRKAFDKMTKEQQDDLKKIDGWYSGATFEGKWRNKKNLNPRNLMTIDIDYPMDGLLELIDAGLLGMSDYVGLWHSSRRHTATAPRVRGLFPLSRKATTDEYTALVRYAGWKIDREMKTVDPVSYRPAQMMFKPTCSVDDAKDYFYYLQSEDYHRVIDVDAWLDEITVEFGDWTDILLLPRHPDEENFRKHAEKAEDPLLKRGPVGDFCRAYPDIEVGMEKFLEGVYEPTEVEGRYTYVGATSSSGAVIYEGKFLYSFHGTDPVNEQLVNLFDLIRIHKFGEEDDKPAEEYKRISDRPSWKSMLGFIKTDPGYKKSQIESKYGAIYDADFDYEDDEESRSAAEEDSDQEDDQEGDLEDDAASDADDSDGGAGSRDDGPHKRADWSSAFDEFEEPRADAEPKTAREKGPSAKKAAKKRAWEKPREDWMTTILDYTEEGDLKATVSNIRNILQFEKRFWGKIGFNEFTQRPVLIGDIVPKLPGLRTLKCKDPDNGDTWQDHMENTFHVIFESPRGANSMGWNVKVAQQDIRIAVDQAARSNSFHPIRERFEESKWDGVPRAERVFIDYFGEPDIPYVREVARMFFTAAIYRVMTPGLKWDNTLMIQGPQGCRKSTFCKVLGWHKYHGELHARLDDYGRIAEQIGGSWILELPELAGFTKTDANHLKTFTRKTKDDWRMAYGHNVAELPRQFVLIGTTNQNRVLKDDTGNRTYLMLRVNVPVIDIDKLEANVDQIWAEAYQWYLEAREKQPVGDLTLDYKTPEAKAEAEFRQNVARMETLTERLVREVLEWADQPITLRKLLDEMGLRDRALDMFGTEEDAGETDAGAVLVRRTTFREKDIREFVFKQDKLSFNPQTDVSIQGVLDFLNLNGWPRAGGKRTRFGTRTTGLRGVWYDRASANADDLQRGYEPFVEDDADDFDDDDFSDVI